MPDDIDKPKKKKKRRSLPVFLTPAEAVVLEGAALAAVNDALTPVKQLAAWRDFAMICTGMLAGPRVAELCGLTVTDVDLAGAMITIRRGKGNRDRNVLIGSRLRRILGEWIGDRKVGFLFPGPKGKRLSRRTFQMRLGKLAVKAGIVKRVHPHMTRHSYACDLLRTGSDVREVQELLGHADLATTSIYLHALPERLTRILHTFHQR